MSTLTLNKFASTSLVDNTVSTVSRKISALSSVFSHCKSSVTDNSVGVVETTDVLVSNEELRRFDQAISAKFHQVLDKSQTPITRVVFREVDRSDQEDNDDLSLLLVAPEELGHFTPRYGEPVMMHFAQAERGTFTPVDFDEVDMEFFDL